MFKELRQACPECQVNLEWHDATQQGAGHFECPSCHASYHDVDEIKAKILERAKEAGEKAK